MLEVTEIHDIRTEFFLRRKFYMRKNTHSVSCCDSLFCDVLQKSHFAGDAACGGGGAMWASPPTGRHTLIRARDGG